MASKPFSKSLLFFYRFVCRRLGNPMSHHHHHRRSTSGIPTYPKIIQRCPSPLQDHELQLQNQTLILDVEGALLRSSCTFPYFMLVALEAGGFLRGLVLLCLYPLLYCLTQGIRLKAMVMVSFWGIKEEKVARVARVVLPKQLLEDVSKEGFEVVRGVKRVVGLSRMMPRVMVEPFLKEFMGVEMVVGREVKVLRGCYVGLLEEDQEREERLGLVIKSLGEEVIGFGSSSKFGHDHHHPFSHCKEVYLVTQEEKRKWSPLPRDRYPKPLIFHDGRLAFRPTPRATLCMFMWLPLGIPLTVFRTLIFVYLPYSISMAIGSLTGVRTRVINSPVSALDGGARRDSYGHLYVCNHRTLLDPVYISTVLHKQVSTVTYSVSRVSEILSPIRTARLSRNRDEDRRKMERLLSQGDLVVCPEGTTCREPYLLRFSPLFVELVDEIYPVALANWTSMFYGTSTGKFKYLDHFYFLMNPRPAYDVEFMEKISTSLMIDGRRCESFKVANFVQSEVARALGFQPTKLNRKDKYLMLAGNEGVVESQS